MRTRTFLAPLVLVVLLIPGCMSGSVTVPKGQPTRESAATGGRSSESSPAVSASMPALEFIDSATFPEGTDFVAATRLKPGTYKVFLTGDHVRTVQWVQDTLAKRPMLQLGLDAKGTAIFAQWTGRHIGKRVVIAVHGQVVSAPLVQERIVGGSLVVAGQGISRMRGVLESAIVGSP